MNLKPYFFNELPTADVTDAIIFLDIDGTIIADKGNSMPADMQEKIRRLAEKNKVVFASNGSVERSRMFAEMCEVSSISSRKPWPGEAYALAKEYQHKVVIGDKYLTDGLFASGIGAQFIKVKRLEDAGDSVLIRVGYLFDTCMWKIAGYVALLRPWQWVKNLLVLAPIFFAGLFFNLEIVFTGFLAAAIFCVASSAVYVLNDMVDVAYDRCHQTKKSRPLASGRVTLGEGKFIFATLLLLCAIGLWWIPALTPVIVAYLILNGLYSLGIKRVAIVDLVFVAFFYVLRILAGGLATSIYVSPWIVLCVLFGSLFIIVGKRRAEFCADQKVDQKKEHRRAVLEQYSGQALDLIFGVSAGLAVITYGIWTVLEHNSPYLVYSTLFVMLALFRLLNTSYMQELEAESPEKLVFTDVWVLGSFVAWGAYVFFVFYLA